MAIAFLVNKLHIKKCNSICCNTDCTSPRNSESNLKMDDISIKPSRSSYNLNVIDVDLEKLSNT